MEKVIKEIMSFNEAREWDQFHSPANLAKSIVIEAAELLECFQWETDKYDEEHVCEELADVMNYCILLSKKLDVNLEEIILDKLHKNEKKYPVKKAKGKNIKYNKL